MKNVLVFFEKIGAFAICFIVGYLHFGISYNFLLFLFDTLLAGAIFCDFLIDKYEKNSGLSLERLKIFDKILMGVLIGINILGIIIIAKYTYFFESFFSRMFG